MSWKPYELIDNMGIYLYVEFQWNLLRIYLWKRHFQGIFIYKKYQFSDPPCTRKKFLQMTWKFDILFLKALLTPRKSRKLEKGNTFCSSPSWRWRKLRFHSFSMQNQWNWTQNFRPPMYTIQVCPISMKFCTLVQETIINLKWIAQIV